MSHNTCSKCKSLAAYSEKYDAFICIPCNAWLERACDDPDCRYCNQRPEDPRAAYLGKSKTYSDIGILYSLEHFKSRQAGESIMKDDGTINAVFVDGKHIPELYVVNWGNGPDDPIAKKFARGVSVDNLQELYPGKVIQLEWKDA